MALKIFEEKKGALAVMILLLSMIIFTPIFGFLHSSNGDAPFTSNVNVISEPAEAIQNYPTMVVDDAGRAYCAWQDRRNGDEDIYFAKSTDYGESWSNPNIIIYSGPEDQTSPSLAMNFEGTLYIVWEDDRNPDSDIYFARSFDGGDTWPQPHFRVNTSGARQSEPAIAVDSSGVIYVVWEDDREGHYDIYFAKSEDRGETWTDAIDINSDWKSSTQLDPTIAVDTAGTIYVAWEDQINDDFDIYFGKSIDGGNTWTDPSIQINTDQTTMGQTNPTMGVGGEGEVYLAWQDNRWNNLDIYFASSNNSGDSWSNPNIKINTDSTAIQQNPALAVSPTGTIYVTWDDWRNGDVDIYFSYSTNGGKEWKDPNLRVVDDTSAENQGSSTLAVGANGPVFVAWGDKRDDPYDIFAATATAVNPIPTAEFLSVEGYPALTFGIQHIIPSQPTFSFIYTDPHSDSMARYNLTVWDEGGYSLLWVCDRTHNASSGSFVNVTYNTDPYPTNGPSLEDGTTYKLRIKVQNTTGVWGIESEVDFHMNEVLTPMTPVSPSDGSILLAFDNQTVSWTSPGPDSEGDYPLTYFWEVASDPDFTTILESGYGTDNQSTAFDTSPSGYFYWRVNLSDGWEISEYGNQPDGYWVFSTYTPFAGNHPPTITNKDSVPTKVVVNSSIIFTFNATDPDSDPLTWGKISGSGWLHLDPNNGTIYGTPSWEALGFNEFKIQVSDGKGGYDNHTFKIDVNKLNNPPKITNRDLVPTKATVKSAVNFTFLATDLDGDTLSWSKISGPEWLKIDVFNGTIYGTPSEDNLGSNSFTIEVSDGRGGFDNHTFIIKVEKDEQENFEFLCLILALLLIILILIILSLLKRRKKEEEEEKTEEIHSKEVGEEDEPPPPDDEEFEPPGFKDGERVGEKVPSVDVEEEEPPPPDDE